MARLVRYESRHGLIQPTKESIDALEAFIRWCEVECPGELNTEMQNLCRVMAIVNQGFARELSFGPHDPSGAGATKFQLLGRSFTAGTSGPATPIPHYQRSNPRAWKIPVRRITGKYYIGWKVKRAGRYAWVLYNDSREAYYIEFGISTVGWGAGRHVPKGRVRRPIRKLSLLKTLRFMQTTSAYQRVWSNIFASPKYRGTHGHGFLQQVQSPAKGSFTGYVRPLP